MGFKYPTKQGSQRSAKNFSGGKSKTCQNVRTSHLTSNLVQNPQLGKKDSVFKNLLGREWIWAREIGARWEWLFCEDLTKSFVLTLTTAQML